MFEPPKWPRITFRKMRFSPGFDPILVLNRPLCKPLGIFHGPKRGTTGSKRVKKTCLSIPNGPRSLLGKRVFDSFLSHLWSQKGPFSRHFGIFRGPKRATTDSKWPKNTCLSIPSGLGTTLKKNIFFASGTPVDPPLAPIVRGLWCPPATRSDHWYEGVRISLGDSEAWKPQNVGGGGWNRCPRNLVLSDVTQDTARSWFWLCWTQITHVRPFLAIFRPFLGHIVELEGNKGLLFTGQWWGTWSVTSRLPSFGRYDWVLGSFWAKKGCFRAQNAQFWEGTSRPGASAPGRQR